MKKYECVEDYQKTDWCVGEIDTIEGWRKRAIEWADSDGYDDVIEQLNRLPENEVMDYISDFWEIGFKEIE